MRGSSIVHELNERDLRETATANYTPPKLKSPFVGSPSCYAKFGQRSHIRDAFDHGILKITPAAPS